MAGGSALRGLSRGIVLRRGLLWMCVGAALAGGVAADHPQAAHRAELPAATVSREAGAVPPHRGMKVRDGALIRVSGLDRVMTYDAAIAESAVVIGDSQTGPGTWVARGLAEMGYRTVLRGAGGTGYTAGNGTVGNYYTALTGQQWLLPYGTPKLVVLQGGGNDAWSADPDIARAAEAMIGELRATYPQSRLVMVGVISTSRTAAGVRRAEVDELLAGVAAREGVEFLRVGDWWDRYSLGLLLQPDGRHFTDAGQQAAGTVFARELGRLLGTPG